VGFYFFNRDCSNVPIHQKPCHIVLRGFARGDLREVR
jgi:hypothetical protein